MSYDRKIRRLRNIIKKLEARCVGFSVLSDGSVVYAVNGDGRKTWWVYVKDGDTAYKDTGRKPSYYDAILTGDLGYIGKDILTDITEKSESRFWRL